MAASSKTVTATPGSRTESVVSIVTRPRLVTVVSAEQKGQSMNADDALDFILDSIEGIHPRDVRDYLFSTEDPPDYESCVELADLIHRVASVLSSSEVRAAVIAAAETD